ncbi:MAG TPA: ABC transporter permease [Candidatus Limnocylindrales bacterium]|nr:ABC transporter permease [Candidatus Limnocylindrales bacterium]
MSQGEAAASIRHSSGPVPMFTLLRQGVADILSRRRLVRYLVQAEMKKRGSDTILGNLWWILDPILQMVVYVVFITIIARRPTPDYPLFIFAAIVPWKWYSSVLSDAATTVARQDKLIRQIAFPKLVLPTATTVAGVVGFAWGILPLLALLLLHSHRFTLLIVWVPVIAAVQFVFTLASAVLISAANVFFRDLGNAVGHVLRLWWFLSPGLYSLQQLEDIKYIQDHHWLGILAGLNPFAVLFEAYRAVIYGDSGDIQPSAHVPDLTALGILLLASLVFLGLCIVFFKRVEPDFAKVL